MLEYSQLFAQYQGKSFDKGTIILYQGEVPRSACIIKSGIVRVYSISARGDEQIVTYHIANEFFPSSWIFGKSPSTLFFYEAIDNCEISFVPRNELIEDSMKTPARINDLLDYFTTNYSASLMRINALQQPHAQNKLAYTLYYLCQRYGRGTGKRLEIPLSLTHQNLANLVGLTRETTTTEVNKLKKLGIINQTGQFYSVDTEKLLETIGEDSLRGVNIQ